MYKPHPLEAGRVLGGDWRSTRPTRPTRERKETNEREEKKVHMLAAVQRISAHELHPSSLQPFRVLRVHLVP
jgi:hypothetical protein